MSFPYDSISRMLTRFHMTSCMKPFFGINMIN
jgi:hypothetical protein